MSDKRILVVNPGGVSTKIACFINDRKVEAENLEHDPAALKAFSRSIDQLDYRMSLLFEVLFRWGVKPEDLDASVGRGGPFGPMPGGVYQVDQAMIEDTGAPWVITDHPSMLGCLMAHALVAPFGKPAFIADPVCVDELDEEAKLTGLKGVRRKALWHALNSRYVARLAAEKHGLAYEKARIVVAHLGSGISLSAHVQGRVRDLSNPNDLGPFSPTRAGEVPATALVELCFSPGAEKKRILERLHKRGGFIDLLGTEDLREVERRVDAGEGEASLAWRAMAYQVAKEIGALSVVCHPTQLIVITGGLARSNRLCEAIRARVGHLAPVEVLPGEMEMEALAAAALRVLRGEETARRYADLRPSRG